MQSISYYHVMKRPFIKQLFLLNILLFSLLGIDAGAAEVKGLYQAKVTVESRDSDRQRVSAFATAFRQVLTKLTGHDEVLDNPTIQAALRSPQAYVETWTYRTEVLPDTGAQVLSLEIVFFQAAIQRLLDDAGVALWPQNRPETLVWMVIQDESGMKMFADPSTGEGNDVIAALQLAAQQRGLPLSTPLLDFDDQSILRPEQLWDFDVEALRLASSRYPFDSVLAIRVFKTVSGQVVAKALHLFRDQSQAVEVFDATLADFATASTALVTRQLANNYGVYLSSNASMPKEHILLSIDGINGINDYAAVLAYLGKVPGISALQMREVAGNKLTFSLNTVGQVRQLMENLALDRRLQPLVDVSSSTGVHLQYHWQTQ